MRSTLVGDKASELSETLLHRASDGFLGKRADVPALGQIVGGLELHQSAIRDEAEKGRGLVAGRACSAKVSAAARSRDRVPRMLAAGAIVLRIARPDPSHPWLTLPKALTEIEVLLKSAKPTERSFLVEHRNHLSQRLKDALAIL